MADACDASRILLDRLGLVLAFAMHAGMVVTAECSRILYSLGVSPVISVNRELNEPSEVQPTCMQASVTLTPARKSAMARSMRRVIR